MWTATKYKDKMKASGAVKPVIKHSIMKNKLR